MDNNKEIKQGAFLSYIQMALNVIIGLVYTPAMIRSLGPSEYGLYNTVASAISMFSLLNLGFNAGYIRYFAKYILQKDESKINKLNGLFLVIFTIMGVIALICGLYLAHNLQIIFDKGLTEKELNIAKILMILLSINLAESFPASVFTTIISANEKFVILKLFGMFKTVIGPLIILPLLFIGYRSVAMVTVTLIVSICVDIIYCLYVTEKLNNKFEFKDFEPGIFRELVIYTSFIAINIVVDQINWNIDKILLGRYKGTTSVAVYSVGYSLFSYYMMLSTSISGVFTPRIHNIVANYKKDKNTLTNHLTALFVKVGRIQFIILALASTGFIFWGSDFIRFWAGKGYEKSYYVALLLILSGSIALTQNMGIEMQRAQNLHQFRSITYLLMAILNFGISIGLCQLYGAVGSAMGTAFSLIVANGIVMNIYYKKRCNIDVLEFWKNIFSMLPGLVIPVIIGILWCEFIGNDSIIKFVLGIIIYTMSYVLSIYMISMNKEEKINVKKIYIWFRKLIQEH